MIASPLPPPSTDAPVLREDDLFLLLRHLARVHGQRLDLYREKCLRRRVEARLRLHGIGSCGEYLRYLRAEPAEAERLRQALTIPVSRFFRNGSSFHALERLALPEILRMRGGDRVRMWSAGVARGEEAYSLAILWHRFTADLPAAPPLSVLGTDVDEEGLARARKGAYPSESFVEVPPVDVERFFVREGEQHRVAPRIRERVTFRAGDLTGELRVRGQDLIACRNVLIYFDTHARRRVIDIFHDRLVPGGVLLLGHSESLLNVTTAFELLHLKEDLVYRKPTPAFPRFE